MANYDIDALAMELFAGEGFRDKPYKDTEGVWTVGVGRNLERGDRQEEYLKNRDWQKSPLTKAEGRDMLINDIAHVDGQLQKRIKFYNQLDGKRQRSLVNVAFNIGIGGLMQFKSMLSHMEKAVNAKDQDTAKRHFKMSADNLENNYNPDGSFRGKTKYWDQVKIRGPRVKYQIMSGKEHPQYQEYQTAWNEFGGM